jgi:hypothetical protein
LLAARGFLHSGSSPPPGALQCPDFDLVIRNGTVGIWFDEGAGAFFRGAGEDAADTVSPFSQLHA